MTDDTVGVVLAGGASRRMGGKPKALEQFGDVTLLVRAASRLSEQVRTVIVNGPVELSAHVPDGTVVVPDPFDAREGPLAGILAAMEWTAANVGEAGSVVSAAVDTPFFPADLAERLGEAKPAEGIAVARAGGRPQPAFGLWSASLRGPLRSFLTNAETRKVMAFVGQHEHGLADWDDISAFDNVNTPDDLVRARQRLGA